MKKTLIVVMTLAVSQLCYAEIKVYQSTDNTGINKKEQIEVVETYLKGLSVQLQIMESKIDESAKKLKTLEASIYSIKEIDLKKLQDQIVPQKDEDKTSVQKENDEEMDKLKADILKIKNDDIIQLYRY